MIKMILLTCMMYQSWWMVLIPRLLWQPFPMMTLLHGMELPSIAMVAPYTTLTGVLMQEPGMVPTIFTAGLFHKPKKWSFMNFSHGIKNILGKISWKNISKSSFKSKECIAGNNSHQQTLFLLNFWVLESYLAGAWWPEPASDVGGGGGSMGSTCLPMLATLGPPY